MTLTINDLKRLMYTSIVCATDYHNIIASKVLYPSELRYFQQHHYKKRYDSAYALLFVYLVSRKKQRVLRKLLQKIDIDITLKPPITDVNVNLLDLLIQDNIYQHLYDILNKPYFIFGLLYYNIINFDKIIDLYSQRSIIPFIHEILTLARREKSILIAVVNIILDSEDYSWYLENYKQFFV